MDTFSYTTAVYYEVANHSTAGTTSLGYNGNDRRTNPLNMSRFQLISTLVPVFGRGGGKTVEHSQFSEALKTINIRPATPLDSEIVENV